MTALGVHRMVLLSNGCSMAAAFSAARGLPVVVAVRNQMLYDGGLISILN